MSIIAAVDSSPMASEVVARAIRHATQSGLELHVIHVYQPPAVVYAMDGPYVFDDEAFYDAELEAVWGSVEPQLVSSGVEWKRVDLTGYPPSAITEYAREHEAGLIVVGTRGRGDFQSLVLGSTSHGVIHDSSCDVLVVKAPQDGSETDG